MAAKIRGPLDPGGLSILRVVLAGTVAVSDPLFQIVKVVRVVMQT